MDKFLVTCMDVLLLLGYDSHPPSLESLTDLQPCRHD